MGEYRRYKNLNKCISNHYPTADTIKKSMTKMNKRAPAKAASNANMNNDIAEEIQNPIIT